MRNDELIKRFIRGETTGTASRMEIREMGDGTALVGYGWALYAYRSPSGEIQLYNGWDGYSSTTTKHLRYFKPDEASYAVDIPMNLTIVDERREVADGPC